ncbi:hypothetical protein ANCCEY_12645 [Ancylostoma ceylanicum]|uniref:Uncharacterized protein n=1 Tax=Ancylostoma ceylanicum TaxID=53326 RepID=A0A0D6L9A3_9BILA|nr:hypothetical protein ANCCEY_12645 [Ancylostoma ceylanicum]
MSVDSDHETFLSAGDLRINLWHHEATNESFNIVDIGYFVDIVGIKTNMEESTKVCKLIGYTRLCGMSERAKISAFIVMEILQVNIVVKTYTMAGKVEEETDPVPNSLEVGFNGLDDKSEEDDRLEKIRMDGTFTSSPRDWQPLCGKKSGNIRPNIKTI